MEYTAPGLATDIPARGVRCAVNGTIVGNSELNNHGIHAIVRSDDDGTRVFHLLMNTRDRRYILTTPME